jgi:hypothetical protein
MWEMKMNVLVRHTILVLMLVLAGVATAQNAPQTPPKYCEENTEFDQWDFWVGEWTVYANDENRTLAGTNSITKHHANCLIKETWVNTAGNGGFSLNYYNPVQKQWRQVWVSNGYSIDYTGGLNEKGQMVLEGEIYNYRPDSSNAFRGIWTPQENGDVIQRFEVHDAENDTWNVWFEGIYVKK